ncbi:MAG: hypothetical protein IJU16_05320 [Clostridia bacterium]|nr:hypothetical protein [Clostridia bacterium]
MNEIVWGLLPMAALFGALAEAMVIRLCRRRKRRQAMQLREKRMQQAAEEQKKERERFYWQNFWSYDGTQQEEYRE